MQEALSYFDGEQELPRRINNDGTCNMVEWFVQNMKYHYLHSTSKNVFSKKSYENTFYNIISFIGQL